MPAGSFSWLDVVVGCGEGGRVGASLITPPTILPTLLPSFPDKPVPSPITHTSTGPHPPCQQPHYSVTVHRHRHYVEVHLMFHRVIS